MAVKIKDIAERTGYSPASVSMALNNRPGISEKARAVILKAVEELGYSTPNARWVDSTSGTIEFIVFKKHSRVVGDTPFFSPLIEGIVEHTKLYGFQVAISYHTSQTLKAAMIAQDRAPLRGVIVLATEMERRDIDLIDRRSTPVVFLDNYFLAPELDCVTINNIYGSYSATEYLVGKGHKKIGHLSSSIQINNFQDRTIGYCRALQEHSIPFQPEFTVSIDSTLDGAYLDMKAYLAKSPELPTAYFADNDILAFGALKALKEAHVKVPDDVSLIGFDNVSYCAMMNPTLTTVNVDKSAMGRVTVDRLVQKIRENLDHTPTFLKTELGVNIVERDSVRDLTLSLR